MRKTALILLLVSVALGGCKKSSKEYFEAQRRFDSLTAQEGDEAYVMPEMDQVTQMLSAVPTRAFEYDRAQALLAKIATEKARVTQERAATAVKPPSDEPYKMPELPSGTGPSIPSAAAVDPFDGGVPEQVPVAGMSEALFKEQFGACVTGPETLKLEGVGDVPAYPAKNTPECLRKLGLTSAAKLFFVKGGLAGRVASTTSVTRTILDGGVTTKTLPAPQPPTLFNIPGAPIGGNTPPPAPGSLPPGATGDGMAPAKADSDMEARPNP